MNKLLEKSDAYIKTMDYIDMGILKVCLVSLGMLFGLGVSVKHKKAAVIGSGVVFGLTYYLCMNRFLGFLYREGQKEEGKKGVYTRPDHKKSHSKWARVR